MTRRLLVAICFLSIGSFVLADDWPQFRGPNRDGVSKEKGLLAKWPKDGPKLLWTFKDAGLGFSSMSIAKGVVYTLGTDMKFTDEYLIAIDEKKGTEKWRLKIGPLYGIFVKDEKGKVKNVNSYGDGPRSTPTVDGDFVYCLGGVGDLVCVDIKKQAIVWQKNLKNDLGGLMMGDYGVSEAPLVDGKFVICTPGGPKGTLAALDKTNGKVEWRSDKLTNQAPYTSIVVAEIQGVRQYVQTSFSDEPKKRGGVVSGIAAKDGAVLWSMPFFSGDNDGIGTSPVVAGNEVYVTAGFGSGLCQLFEIDAKQNATGRFGKAAKKSVKNAHGGMVRIGDHAYGYTVRQMWVCQDLKTGDVTWWDDKSLKCESGSIIAADGKLYLYSDDGEIGLINADPAKFDLVSSFRPPVKSSVPGNQKERPTSRFAKLWSHPAIANGVLYVRDHEYIFAFKITK